jgi:hypothetical protein
VTIIVGALLYVRRRKARDHGPAAVEFFDDHDEVGREEGEVDMHDAYTSAQGQAPLSIKRSAMLERQGLVTSSRLPVNVVQRRANSTPMLPRVPQPMAEDEREAMEHRFELLQQQVDALARNLARGDASDASVPPAYGQ